MNDSASSLQVFIAEFQSLMSHVFNYLPKIAVAVLVLVIGWVIARLSRLLVVRMISRLDQLWQNFIMKRGSVHLQPRQPPARIVGGLVFWLLLLIFVTLATEILGLDIFGIWLKAITTYLPLVIAGLLIVIIGFIVSSLARDLVSSTMTSSGMSHGDLLGRSAQIVILFIAIVIGVDQIGIDIKFLSVIVGIILSAVLGSLALAFGLGAQTHVRNIIAANQLRQLYQIGDKVRVGNIEGRIVDILVSRVLIETETGSVDVPAKIFDEEVTTITDKGV
ncbi:MAG: mechanosensitive ion channel [Gammaproteobacteria bacterium]|nr:mechanosensitive ion channel [Gammaproteobacteria bacterium]MCW8986566.1 mechanosensitive ion channel [Gammaproteobacteria bacterium]MCW9031975.1 mechanosensitive ion channel [Gammaproteobacteria bacterium]